MKVKELIKRLSRLDQDSTICIAEPYDGGYVTISSRHLKKIYKPNGYSGYLLEAGHKHRDGEIPLSDDKQ